jgi:DNA polymerase/3'-5' exonuclease PolX
MAGDFIFKKMNLQTAKQKAEDSLCFWKPYAKRLEIVGSVRRECPEVNDIDIIIIPNESFQTAIQDLDKSVKKKGDKLIIYELNGTQYDLYICTEENYEVIKLIRTGSKEHNQKLCILAKQKGLSLKAGGIGLVDSSGKVISNTEKGILENLLGKYIEPKDRK